MKNIKQLQTKDNQAIFYETWGNPHNEPVFLFHGWLLTTNHFFDLPHLLENDYYVILPHFRGHGLSTPANSKMSIQNLTSDIREIIQHENLTDVNFIGHSMGGSIIWEYLQNYGDNSINSICIADMSLKIECDSTWQYGLYGSWDRTISNDFIQKLDENFVEAMIYFALSNLAKNKNEEEIRKVNTEFLNGLNKSNRLNFKTVSNIYKDFAFKDYRDVFMNIKLPQLVVYADESEFYTKETGPALKELNDQIQLEYLPHATHILFFEHSEEFLKLWLNFKQEIV